MKAKILLLTTVTTALLWHSARAAVTDGLVGHWKFNETSGMVAADSTSNHNDGALVNYPIDATSQWVPGPMIGGALALGGYHPAPGVSEYVNVPDYPKGNGQMSASLWVWLDGFSSAAPMPWVLLMAIWPQTDFGGRQFHFGIRGGGIGVGNHTETTDGTSFSEGTVAYEGKDFPLQSWQQVGFTVDGSFLRIYRNGQQVAQAALVGGAMVEPPSPSPFAIGRRVDLDWSSLHGSMDDIGLWSRALSADEMNAIYQAGLGGNDLASTGAPAKPPTIVVQPQSTSRFVGDNFSLSVSVYPLVESYQWFKGGQMLPGATNRILAFGATSTNDAGSYTVTVSNSVNTVTSAPATVSIQAITGIVTGLAGHWRFDETNGLVAADSTTNGNSGNLVNFPTDNSEWVTGRIGGALSFGGVDTEGYIQVTGYHPQPINGAMTVCAWIWSELESDVTYAVTPQFIGSWGSTGAKQQFYLGTQNIAGSTNLSASIQTADGSLVTASESAALPFGSWQHAALVVDGANLRIYRNGLQVAAAALPPGSQLAPLTGPLDLVMGNLLDDSGANPLNLADAFFGQMDDVGLWVRALNPNEILSIYKGGLAGKDLASAAVTVFPPAMATQPQSQTVIVGDPFSLSVAVTGTAPLAYQWSKNGQVLAGATNSVLTVSGAGTNDSGSYSVLVSNLVGSVTSSNAVVAVTPIVDITTGLAGHWRLNDGGGLVAADSTTNGNDGTLANYPDSTSEWVPGPLGGALDFAGDDSPSLEYVGVADYPKGHGRMAASLWVWFDGFSTNVSNGTWVLLLGNWPQANFGGRQFHFGIQGGNIGLNNFVETTDGTNFFENTTTSENRPFPLGSWQQVGFVADGSYMRLYHNGEEVAKVAQSAGLVEPPSPSPFQIGCRIEVPTSFFQGKMEDVGLWVRALSGEEMRGIYQAGLAAKDLTKAVPVSRAPAFSSQPQNITVFPGDTATLSPTLVGDEPFFYQWTWNGQPIPGATNATLTLSDISANNAGTYALQVSNLVGSATSSNAVVALQAVVGITSGLAGHWTFDDGSGLVLKDSTANGNDGVLGNFPQDGSQWITGQIGGALHFRGSSARDYVVVPNYPKPFGIMSISIWLWTDVRPSDWTMVVNDWSGSCGQFHMGLFGGVDIANFTANGGCGAILTREGAAFPVASWQHVAFVADGSMMRLYRNGQQVSAAPYDGTLYQPVVSSFGIGMKPSADGSGPGAYWWQGSMDDLGIWKRALTPGEVGAIYSAGLAGQDLTTATVVSLTVTRSAGGFTLTWPAAAVGFVLESTKQLGSGASWTTVPGVVANSITISATNATTFYRLKKP